MGRVVEKAGTLMSKKAYGQWAYVVESKRYGIMESI